MRKKVLMNIINNSEISYYYRDLFLCKDECKEKLLYNIKSEKFKKLGLVSKLDGKTIIFTTKENTIKNTLGNGFSIQLNLNFLNI